METFSWMHGANIQTDPRMPKTWRALVRTVGGGVEEAISQGAVLTRRIWHSQEMLTPVQVAKQLGITTHSVSRLRRQNRLFGLSIAGELGYRYPLWHFETNVLAALPDVMLEIPDKKSWNLYYFLTQPEGLLGGKSPLDMLKKNHVSEVIQVARLLRDAK